MPDRRDKTKTVQSNAALNRFLQKGAGFIKPTL